MMQFKNGLSVKGQLWRNISLVFLWPPYVIRLAIIFLPYGFFLSSSSFPRLISAAADWVSTVHTSTHGVALVRI